MELARDFECDPLQPLRALKIKHRPRQSLPSSPTGVELQELKGEMVKASLYRFADMTVLANKALDAYPELVNRIRLRFPLVILDSSGRKLPAWDHIVRVSAGRAHGRVPLDRKR
jgi:ATP-dependent DNA helicase UvrD/PcrA